MARYTIHLNDSLEAEVQREVAQRLREEPGLTPEALVQRYAEPYWRIRAHETQERARRELADAILKAPPATAEKVRRDLGLP